MQKYVLQHKTSEFQTLQIRENLMDLVIKFEIGIDFKNYYSL